MRGLFVMPNCFFLAFALEDINLEAWLRLRFLLWLVPTVPTPASLHGRLQQH